MSDLCVTLDSEKLIYKRKLRFSETAQALISYILNKLRLYGRTLTRVNYLPCALPLYKYLDNMNHKLGLTSIIKLPPEIIENISEFLNQYKEKPNDPHFYNPENLHITLLGLIPMSDNIHISIEDKHILKKIFKKVFDRINEPIPLQVTNLGKTSSSLYLKVKNKNGVLHIIRKKLIDAIIMSPLKFDEEHICSYNLNFGWCTIARFTKPNKYIEKIIDSKSMEFGSFEVQKISIVITDKYYSKKNAQELFSIILS